MICEKNMGPLRRCFWVVVAVFWIAGCGDDIGADNICDDNDVKCSINGDVIELCSRGRWEIWTDCSVIARKCGKKNYVYQCLLSEELESDTHTDTDTTTPVETDSATDSATSGDSATNSDSGSGETGTEITGTDTGSDAIPSDSDSGSDTDSGTVDTSRDDTATATDTAADTATFVGTDSDSATSTESDVVDTENICGNGVVGPEEACDDGNWVLGDGCNHDCRLEPDCSDTAGCVTVCGDGFVMAGEGCDDGNLKNGDGCSASCTVESDYSCSSATVGDSIPLAVVYRDFVDAEAEEGGTNPDFSQRDLSGCNAPTRGMVLEALDPGTGKPIFNSSDTADTGNPENPEGCDDVTSRESFAEWFAHGLTGEDAVAAGIVGGELTLWRNDAGEFVNRWLEDGTRFSDSSKVTAAFCANAGGSCADCESKYTEAAGYTCENPCDFWGDDQVCTVKWDERIEMDGNPLFFPIDGNDFDSLTATAQVPAGEPYNGGWKQEEEYFADNHIDPPDGYSYDHNFFFTSELHFWFVYRASQTQKIGFFGDDDVWVFVNQRLVIDMGGVHVPTEQQVELDAVADDIGLEDNKLYEAVVFQAERQPSASSYKLTLTGFSSAGSVCTPK